MTACPYRVLLLKVTPTIIFSGARLRQRTADLPIDWEEGSENLLGGHPPAGLSGRLFRQHYERAGFLFAVKFRVTGEKVIRDFFVFLSAFPAPPDPPYAKIDDRRESLWNNFVY